MGGLIFYEVGFAYFRVVRSVCGSMLVAGGQVGWFDGKVVELCFLDAVLKGLVKKVAKLWIFVICFAGGGMV